MLVRRHEGVRIGRSIDGELSISGESQDCRESAQRLRAQQYVELIHNLGPIGVLTDLFAQELRLRGSTERSVCQLDLVAQGSMLCDE